MFGPCLPAVLESTHSLHPVSLNKPKPCPPEDINRNSTNHMHCHKRPCFSKRRRTHRGLFFLGPVEDVLRRQHGHHSEDLLWACQVHRGNQHLGHWGLQGKLRHLPAQTRQQAFLVQRTQVEKHLQRVHQGLLKTNQPPASAVIQFFACAHLLLSTFRLR